MEFIFSGHLFSVAWRKSTLHTYQKYFLTRSLPCVCCILIQNYFYTLWSSVGDERSFIFLDLLEIDWLIFFCCSMSSHVTVFLIFQRKILVYNTHDKWSVFKSRQMLQKKNPDVLNHHYDYYLSKYVFIFCFKFVS